MVVTPVPISLDISSANGCAYLLFVFAVCTEAKDHIASGRLPSQKYPSHAIVSHTSAYHSMSTDNH